MDGVDGVTMGRDVAANAGCIGRMATDGGLNGAIGARNGGDCAGRCGARSRRSSRNGFMGAGRVMGRLSLLPAFGFSSSSSVSSLRIMSSIPAHRIIFSSISLRGRE